MRVRRIFLILCILVLALMTTATVALAQQQTYTVQPGDNLYRIALRFGLTVEQIASANGITNPAQIYAGQVLTIPTGSGSQGSTGGTTSYTIQAGDTLYSIARRFNTTVDRLVALNGLTNPNALRIGQVLVVPGQATTTPATATPAASTTPTTPAPTATTAPTSTPIPPTATPTPQQRVTYTVKAGDTLSQIAVRFGTSYQQLAILNGLENPNLIYPGEVLIISEGTTTPTPTATRSTTSTSTATAAGPIATLTATAAPTATPTAAVPTATVTVTPTGPTSTAGPSPTLDPNVILTPTPIVPMTTVPADAPNLLADPGFEIPRARSVSTPSMSPQAGSPTTAISPTRLTGARRCARAAAIPPT